MFPWEGILSGLIILLVSVMISLLISARRTIHDLEANHLKSIENSIDNLNSDFHAFRESTNKRLSWITASLYGLAVYLGVPEMAEPGNTN